MAQEILGQPFNPEMLQHSYQNGEIEISSAGRQTEPLSSTSVHPWMFEYRKCKNGKQGNMNTEKSSNRHQGRQASATKYTQEQLFELEKEFHTTPYLSNSKRTEMARRLNLSERQIKVWFQNKRMRLKKATKGSKEVEREKKGSVSEVLHYFNPRLAGRAMENIDDEKLMTSILENIRLKRLPSKTTYQCGQGNQNEDIVNYDSCFPVSQVPPEVIELRNSSSLPFAPSTNSSFDIYRGQNVTPISGMDYRSCELPYNGNYIEL